MDKTSVEQEQGNGISVVINTYNASCHLQQVLDTVKGFDEVVVCDMESTDDTLDIAKRNGCKIVVFPRGSYQICEPARQTAIDAASCKWVLVVDADELVTPALKQYLYSLIGRRMLHWDCMCHARVALWEDSCIVSIPTISCVSLLGRIRYGLLSSMPTLLSRAG